jgi:hypothetical protein
MVARAAWQVFALATAIKVLLIPSYRSTDFEVHRNWLALTHSLPLKDWYFEKTSEWTLDYPPFFAWFEYVLSHAAKLFDPAMLTVDNLSYASTETVIFQRCSVIATDLVLFLSIGSFLAACRPPKESVAEAARSAVKDAVIMAITFLNPGLLLVDHIHFQYNGFLLGLFIYSVSLMRQGRDLFGGVVYATCLMFKHMYLYVAPLYFVYLLRHHCCPKLEAGGAGQKNETGQRKGKESDQGKAGAAAGPEPPRGFSFARLVVLGGAVLCIFAAAFLPFLAAAAAAAEKPATADATAEEPPVSASMLALRGATTMLAQIGSRLFPFQRGLCHAYWAPNVWALYNFADKVRYSRCVVCQRTGSAGVLSVKGAVSVKGGVCQRRRLSRVRLSKAASVKGASVKGASVKGASVKAHQESASVKVRHSACVSRCTSHVLHEVSAEAPPHTTLTAWPSSTVVDCRRPTRPNPTAAPTAARCPLPAARCPLPAARCPLPAARCPQALSVLLPRVASLAHLVNATAASGNTGGLVQVGAKCMSSRWRGRPRRAAHSTAHPYCALGQAAVAETETHSSRQVCTRKARGESPKRKPEAKARGSQSVTHPLARSLGGWVARSLPVG